MLSLSATRIYNQFIKNGHSEDVAMRLAKAYDWKERHDDIVVFWIWDTDCDIDDGEIEYIKSTGRNVEVELVAVMRKVCDCNGVCDWDYDHYERNPKHFETLSSLGCITNPDMNGMRKYYELEEVYNAMCEEEQLNKQVAAYNAAISAALTDN